MTRRYSSAAAVAVLGIGSVIWVVVARTDVPPLALLLAAVAPPLAVLLAVVAKFEVRFPRRSLVRGATIGPLFAVASHAIVAAFASAFLLGFLESGHRLLVSLRADPRINEVLGSPWILVLLIDVVAVAPLTEEIGKALAAGSTRPGDRREAFVAGVAAGAGFDVVENLLYMAAGAAFGAPWAVIATARALGTAVHPLATGLAAVGGWEWRREHDLVRLAKWFLSGAGVHALWNASLVVLLVVETALAENGALPAALSPIALAYSAAIGVMLCAVLWSISASLAGDVQPSQPAFGDARSIAAWTVLAASMLVPVGLLVLAFPSFYLG
jgi:RsiW-degrading membrane proteinase PrsW (M82 family)